MFQRVDKRMDLVAIERGILAFWKERGIFAKLAAKNRGGPRFSFYDGPITANNPMGVHHAWGRTYKDIFQRYKAMRGFDQRHQNGFDCQGLWVEVEVEKALDLNSKREIVSHGLDKFSRACRGRVEKYAGIQTEQSMRLGQWMDWEHSYYTHTDANIEYIWHFLQACRERGWLYQGHRSMPWCARCGTSLSAHELMDAYEERSHRSVYLRFPVSGQPNTSFLVWTTTPWTLAANTALAVHPELEYARARVGDETLILSKGTLGVLGKGVEVGPVLRGKDLLGLECAGPFDEFPAQKGVKRRVIGWDAVGETEGTGIVHIAPGCGAEDYELSRKNGLSVLVPIDEAAHYVKGYGFLEGKNVREAADLVFADLKRKGRLLKIQDYRHRYPACWRCGEELVFRLADEWFIRCDEIRPAMKKAAAEVRWIPDHVGKRMQDWLDNMADWCISRKRFWGLPLPFYVCECGEKTIVGSRKELRELAADPARVDALPELHRPWIDEVEIRCPKCAGPVRRITEVGDCWLDAGIVPFSTLKYFEDSEYWEKWFPAEFVCEMREQVRLWFYSTLFMSVTLGKGAPYRTVLAYEKVHDEANEPMHKSKGNAIPFDEAADKMGADAMRWMYAAASIETNLRFGYGPAKEVRRKLLTFWNVYSFFVEYANIDKPDLSGGLSPQTPGLTELDRWILARLNQFVAGAARQYDAYLTAPIVSEAERFFDDLSNWYLRRCRARFWKETMDEDKAAAYRALHHVLLTTTKALAPILPFSMEAMFQNLRKADPGLPESVHLSHFPGADPHWFDEKLLSEMAAVQQVVALGHAVRAGAKLRVRQPLLTCKIAAPSESLYEVIERHRALICDELNVKRLERLGGAAGLIGYKVRLNLPGLGVLSLGPKIPQLQKQLGSSDPEVVVRKARSSTGWDAGGGIVLRESELLIETVQKGDAPASEAKGFVIMLDTSLTPALVAEGRARELVHHIQSLRKELDLPYEARIRLAIDGDAEVLAAGRGHEAYLTGECLAVEVLWGRRDGSPKEVEIDGKKAWVSLTRT